MKLRRRSTSADNKQQRKTSIGVAGEGGEGGAGASSGGIGGGVDPLAAAREEDGVEEGPSLFGGEAKIY